MLLAMTPAAAEELQLEIIDLRHRLVAEMRPALEPLLAPGGTITGQDNHLVLRTTGANLEELRRVVDALDTRPRSLRITVRQRAGENSAFANDAAAVEHRAAGDGDADTGVRLRSLRTETRDDRADTHFVRTVEGQPAFIRSGAVIADLRPSAILVPGDVLVGDTRAYQTVESGFYVIARLHGDQVTLEIAPQLERPSPAGGGAIEVQHAAVTVSGRLGEWLDVGGVTTDLARDDAGVLARTHRHGFDLRELSVRVDEVE